jgi:hypothetical protein
MTNHDLIFLIDKIIKNNNSESKLNEIESLFESYAFNLSDQAPDWIVDFFEVLNRAETRQPTTIKDLNKYYDYTGLLEELRSIIPMEGYDDGYNAIFIFNHLSRKAVIEATRPQYKILSI